jgi:WD40 repeat protein
MVSKLFQAWNPSGTEVITGSEDGYVSQFNIKKSLNILTFRASVNQRKESVNSVVLYPENDRQLLVGTFSKISLWDLDTKTSLRVFEGGHMDNIVSILFVNPLLFLTVGAGEQDHTVCLWSIKDESEAVHFSADEPVEEVFAKTETADDHGLLIGVITKSGSLNYYEHNWSGRKKRKPVQPLKTVQIATEKQDSIKNKVSSIPILAAKFTDECSTNKCIQLAHGPPWKPVFESLMCDKLDKLTCLVRPNATQNGKSNDILGASNIVVCPKTESSLIIRT